MASHKPSYYRERIGKQVKECIDETHSNTGYFCYDPLRKKYDVVAGPNTKKRLLFLLENDVELKKAIKKDLEDWNRKENINKNLPDDLVEERKMEKLEKKIEFLDLFAAQKYIAREAFEAHRAGGGEEKKETRMLWGDPRMKLDGWPDDIVRWELVKPEFSKMTDAYFREVTGGKYKKVNCLKKIIERLHQHRNINTATYVKDKSELAEADLKKLDRQIKRRRGKTVDYSTSSQSNSNPTGSRRKGRRQKRKRGDTDDDSTSSQSNSNSTGSSLVDASLLTNPELSGRTYDDSRNESTEHQPPLPAGPPPSLSPSQPPPPLFSSSTSFSSSDASLVTRLGVRPSPPAGLPSQPSSSQPPLPSTSSQTPLPPSTRLPFISRRDFSSDHQQTSTINNQASTAPLPSFSVSPIGPTLSLSPPTVYERTRSRSDITKDEFRKILNTPHKKTRKR